MNKPCSVHFQYRTDCESCKRASQVNAQVSSDDDSILTGMAIAVAVDSILDSTSVSSLDPSPSYDSGSSFDSFSGGDSGGGGSSDSF